MISSSLMRFVLSFAKYRGESVQNKQTCVKYRIAKYRELQRSSVKPQWELVGEWELCLPPTPTQQACKGTAPPCHYLTSHQNCWGKSELVTGLLSTVSQAVLGSSVLGARHKCSQWVAQERIGPVASPEHSPPHATVSVADIDWKAKLPVALIVPE